MWRTKVRASLLAVVAALAVPLASLALPATPVSAAGKPNIVMIMTDDQPLSTLSKLPNVKKLLAAEGTSFPNTFASYPLCCPSRATYLTGQYPHNHQVMDNKPPHGSYYALRSENTLPVWLSQAGYHTAHIGKYLNRYGSRNAREVPPGWQEWHGLVNAYRMWGYTINHNGKKVQRYGKWNSTNPKLYQTDVLRRLSIDYIDRKAPGPKPFFLSVAPLASHEELGDEIRSAYGSYNPRPAPRHRGAFRHAKLPKSPSFNERSVADKPRYIRKLPPLTAWNVKAITTRYRAQLESLLAVDEMVGAIVAKLRAAGELDNTVIMFTSDNGFFSGEHRITYGKRKPYEPSIRVPLVVRGPGFPKGLTVEQDVSNVDWAATIVRAAGAKAGLPLDGRPLQSLANDPASGDGRQLLFETGPKPGRWYWAIRGDRYKYIVNGTGEVELYDLQADPHELVSRHKDPAYAEARASLEKRLKELRGCRGRACWGLPDHVSDEPPPDHIVNRPPPKATRPGGHAAAGGGGSGMNYASLPVTGMALGVLLVIGAGAVGVGLALRTVRRRTE